MVCDKMLQWPRKKHESSKLFQHGFYGVVTGGTGNWGWVVFAQAVTVGTGVNGLKFIWCTHCKKFWKMSLNEIQEDHK